MFEIPDFLNMPAEAFAAQADADARIGPRWSVRCIAPNGPAARDISG
jgi:hypothetical protein